MDSPELDVVVVGAGENLLIYDHLRILLLVGCANSYIMIGLYGIAASKFYLDAHPQCRLVVLDQDSCPGGSWNSSMNANVHTQLGSILKCGCLIVSMI